jgi:4-hydroxyphenylpyruvate 3-dimethylallyltransferase
MQTVACFLDPFLDDIRNTAITLGAPFSESTTRTVLSAFQDWFLTGSVLWKTTDRPGDSLHYRFFAAGPSDTISAAVNAGLLDERHALLPLVRFWNALPGTPAEQSCDFDADLGLTKTWLYLGGTRPLQQILEGAEIPETIRQHAPCWIALGLRFVRFAAVDYRRNSVNIYFRAPGPITESAAVALANLARAAAPSAEQVAQMQRFLPRHGYTLGITINVASGVTERVCAYAPMLPPGAGAVLPPRLSQFFTTAPCYDVEEANVAAWSFGIDGNYMKAERGCFGGLANTFRRWRTFFSGDSQIDSLLQTPPDASSPASRS